MKRFFSTRAGKMEAEEVDPDSILGQIFAQQLVIVDSIQSLILETHKLGLKVKALEEEVRGRKEPDGDIQAGEGRTLGALSSEAYP